MVAATMEAIQEELKVITKQAVLMSKVILGLRGYQEARHLSLHRKNRTNIKVTPFLSPRIRKGHL